MISGSAFAGAYLKFDGVEGESVDKDHKGWIDVLSVSGLAPQGKSREKGSGMATGKRQHAPVTITKPIDKSSPKLARSSGNPQFPTSLTLSQNGMTYQLTGVKVTSVRQKGNTEELTFTYTGLKQSSATDYNSSRSNRNSSRAVGAPPANHNSTRSNRS